MSKRWSKLQKELYLLFVSKLNLQLHCCVYRMKSQYGLTDLPRYYFTLDGGIIWDYPKDFILISSTEKRTYPHQNSMSDISILIREYINTPKLTLFDASFNHDKWDLIDLLKAADKRIGKTRLLKLLNQTKSGAVKRIINKRLNM